MCGRMAGGFFEETGVALQEEDMKEEVEREGAKVDEGGEETPVLKRVLADFVEMRRDEMR